MMVRSWRLCVVTSMACGLLACSLRKHGAADGGEDAAASAAPSATAAPAASLAANESEVSRYPDETPISHASLRTAWLANNVRTQASSGGELVAVLKRGTDLDKIAERAGWYLVVFPDPSDGSRKEMGWISASVFAAEPPHKHTAIKCTAPGQVAILLQGGDEACVVHCTSDSQCTRPQACDGDGVLSNGGQPGAPVRFCRIASMVADAGGSPPAPAVDAGAAPAVDAAAPPAAVDAAAPPAAVDAGSNAGCKMLDAKKVDGVCPGGYGACGAICRKTCSSDAQCNCPTAKCSGGFCLGPGAAACK